ncbi:MAG: hypothetical protein J0H01_08430 [Rhizobiales bacterium]|nr:hypothetical protein [Hyphomicrobiales bacterium]
MIDDHDREPVPDAQDHSEGAERQASIRAVSVCILGYHRKPTPDVGLRGALLRSIVKAINARDDWASVEVVLLPGGFFRIANPIGHLSDHDRRTRLSAHRAAEHCALSSHLLDHAHPGAVLVVGIDIKPASRRIGGDQLVAAWRDGELVTLARKTFPADGDTNGSGPVYPVYKKDFATKRRFVTLASGARCLLLGCYDAFGGRAPAGERHVDLAAIRLIRDGDGKFVRPTHAIRREWVSRWTNLLRRHPPDLGLVAIHGFVRPGMDGYWQRHGIAGASAALVGIPIIGAAHFNKALPRSVNRSVLAAKDVPLSHLELGPRRPLHALIPDDGFTLTGEDGSPVALIRRFNLALGQKS